MGRMSKVKNLVLACLIKMPVVEELAKRDAIRCQCGFGTALGRLCGGLGGFGRLWETLGEALGRLWEAWGSFGRRWGSVWEVFGRLWEALGRLSKPFRAFLLPTPSLPPLYILKKYELPINRFSGPILLVLILALV